MPQIFPTAGSRSATRMLAAFVLFAGTFSPALAQPTREPDRETLEEHAARIREATELTAVVMQAFAERDFARAKRVLAEQIELVPTNFVPHYNLACAHAATGDLDAAEASLSTAIQHGFDDVHQMRRDGYLTPLRDRALYQDLLDAWPRILEARRAVILARDEQLVPRRAERRTNDALRLEIVSAHDPTATDLAAGELEALGVWLHEHVFPEIATEPWHSHHPWVDVVLPNPKSFADWEMVTFGADSRRGFSAIGGAYDHDRKRLVSRDLGATLRHEFVHVLHWREMGRLGQRHALWTQEGLASLLEDYDVSPAGQIVPVPSWRTNMTKRLADIGRLPTLETLAGTQMERFSATKPLANYAHARTVFLYLLDRDALAPFFDTYENTYTTDPSGLAALHTVTGFEDQQSLEDDFLAWVRALPTVPETGSDLPATLGVEIEEGTGDGPKVVALPTGSRKRTGLRLGSVITAINARPTRDMHELIRVLGSYAPGDTVTLHHRRGRLHTTSDVQLLPRN